RRGGAGNRTDSLAHSSTGEFVSGNYFHTFGLQPQAGRLLSDADDVKGAPAVAVISYRAWMNEYAGEASVVGSTFWLNTKPVTVVGIAPQGFYGDRLATSPPDFYLPISQILALENAQYTVFPETRWLYIVGRIKPGVDRGALQAKLSGQLRQLFAAHKDFSSEHDKPLLARAHVVLTDGGGGVQSMQQEYSFNLKLLMWISGLVLLIACANIANLLLVRGMGRKAEMSVRTALGAARSRIIAQLLTESLVLALLSGIVALGVSYLGTRMLLALAFPGEQNVPIHAGPSWVVLAFALAVSIVTGVLFGVAPAWIAAQAEPADALRSGTRTTTGGASRLQRSLVVLQAALSLVLLIGAGLFARSLSNLQSFDMKLESKNRYIVHINPQGAGYLPSQLEALYRTMDDRFHGVPGVVKVGISSYTPMEDNNWGDNVQIQGKPDLNLNASFVKANAEYFDSVGTHVVMGRGIGVQDTHAAPTVAVVNQAFVKKFFSPGENPIGRHFGDPETHGAGDFEIVGVVEDTTYTNVRWKNHAMYFLPITQRPASDKQPTDADIELYAGTIVLETAQPMNDMEAIARKTLAAINSNLTVVKFQTFDQQIADRFTRERMISRLMTLFGGLALLLASIGLYGVTAYTVARRTSEIGIRMALGAKRRSVVSMVLRSALLQSGLGIAIGISVAILCARYVQTLLYQASSLDPAVLAGAIVMLTLATSIAGVIPARRAASIEPVRALRAE
ncbi:MAG: ABC transporter permease, partial [Acidobacteriaceae bacterium]